jgi:hypothetical protein
MVEVVIAVVAATPAVADMAAAAAKPVMVAEAMAAAKASKEATDNPDIPPPEVKAILLAEIMRAKLNQPMAQVPPQLALAMVALPLPAMVNKAMAARVVKATKNKMICQRVQTVGTPRVMLLPILTTFPLRIHGSGHTLIQPTPSDSFNHASSSCSFRYD